MTHFNVGKKRTSEQCKRMSDAHIGVKLSEEHKKKINENHRTYQSEETKLKLREIHLGCKNHAYGKPSHPTQKAACSKIWDGKHLSDDHKEKIRLSSSRCANRAIPKPTTIGRSGNTGLQK